jgi:hypothetical protein
MGPDAFESMDPTRQQEDRSLWIVRPSLETVDWQLDAVVDNRIQNTHPHATGQITRKAIDFDQFRDISGKVYEIH